MDNFTKTRVTVNRDPVALTQHCPGVILDVSSISHYRCLLLRLTEDLR